MYVLSSTSVVTYGREMYASLWARVEEGERAGREGEEGRGRGRGRERGGEGGGERGKGRSDEGR